jgi:hypothetical protein
MYGGIDGMRMDDDDVVDDDVASSSPSLLILVAWMVWRSMVVALMAGLRFGCLMEIGSWRMFSPP